VFPSAGNIVARSIVERSDEETTMPSDQDQTPANDPNVRREDAGGRTGGGESGGGAFKDPSLVPTEPGSYDGGQSRKQYHGGGDTSDGDENPNAVADHD
jgi:hypothetical protein